MFINGFLKRNFAKHAITTKPDTKPLNQRRQKETKSNIIFKKDIFFSSTYGRLSLRLFHCMGVKISEIVYYA